MGQVVQHTHGTVLMTSAPISMSVVLLTRTPSPPQGAGYHAWCSARHSIHLRLYYPASVVYNLHVSHYSEVERVRKQPVAKHGSSQAPAVRLPVINPWGRWACRMSDDGERIEVEAPQPARPANVAAGEPDERGLWPMESEALRFANMSKADECLAFANEHGLLGLAVHDLLNDTPGG